MKATPSAVSAVPQPIQQLVEVYEQHLSAVEFPALNARTLREQADEVEHAAQALAQARAALERATERHSDALAVLRASADRGLGYARVYGSDDEALSEALSPISLAKKGRTGRSSNAKAPKKRARSKKAQPDNVTELPLELGSA